MATNEENFDYLKIDQSDKNVLKNLSAMGEQLKVLFTKMEEAKAAAEQATKAYNHYANVIIPAEMFSAGVNSLELVSGGMLTIKHNFYCQPNKNAADKKKMVDWLRANGGDNIIKSTATVMTDDIDSLKSSNIPYVEETSVNTATLKAFLKDAIGATTGVQKIKVEDIPECMHFQEVTTVDLTMPKEN